MRGPDLKPGFKKQFILFHLFCCVGFVYICSKTDFYMIYDFLLYLLHGEWDCHGDDFVFYWGVRPRKIIDERS